MNKVLIMLSTYNGEKFLREQLDSLYAQEGVKIHILVRDDGSKDSTFEILREYQQQYGSMTIHADENIGAAMSFHTLMRYAYNEFPDYDYYAFSDQDDVWMKEKLLTANKRLSADSADLYYCNATITDQNLNRVAELGVEHNLSLQYLMFRQPALGCTQVMTNAYFRFCTAAFQKYILHNPPLVELHDVWTMWISQMIDAKVSVDDNPYILYRQHGGNVTTHKSETFLQKAKRVSERTRKNKGKTYANIKIIGEVLQGDLSTRATGVIKRMLGYKSSMFKTISFAFYMQSFFRGVSIKAMVTYRIINRLY